MAATKRPYVEVIDRSPAYPGSLARELVRRGDRYYAEETKQVPYGTMARCTKMYASYDAYCDAVDAGKLVWGEWE